MSIFIVLSKNQSQIPKKYYSLLELTQSVESVIKKTYTSSYWVKAEIAKLNYYPKSGHCYPDLVEKENGVVLAQMRATIWSGQFNDINAKFQNITKQSLNDGMTVLIRTSVGFHPVYGMSLQIVDIEPSFTLGELAKEKQESIDRLIKEGIFHSNKQLKPPLLIQRLAIISVETSKGYQDMIKVIDNNEWGYKFFHMLFPALLQGEGAIKSIIEQLNRIRKVIDHFDSILIIRGGGGDIGLSSFDSFKLAKEVACFPLPIISGIGHATNETVVEQVSFINKITPTEVGYYLIQRFHNFAIRIQNSQNSVIEKTKQISLFEKQRLMNISSGLKSMSDSLIHASNSNLANFRFSIIQSGKTLLDIKRNELQHLNISLISKSNKVLVTNKFRISSLSDKVRLLEPHNVLKRGYSITLFKGNAVRNTEELEVGDEIETLTIEGKMKSIINEIDNN